MRTSFLQTRFLAQILALLFDLNGNVGQGQLEHGAAAVRARQQADPLRTPVQRCPVQDILADSVRWRCTHPLPR